jgi:uncharacterized cupredoxin-like copper-binding protein
MIKRFILPSLVLLAAVTLAACSGSSGPSKSIKVTMTDFTFSPTTFTVPAGEEISLEVSNNGAVTHSFIIMKAGQQVQSHFVEADKSNVYWEQAAVAPGTSIKATFTAPGEPGEYQIVCGIAGHFEAGMVAKLVVVKQP